MKHILLTALAIVLLAQAGFAQPKQPDTSHAPKIYWRELIQLQQINNQLTTRIHKLDIRALYRDTLDMHLSAIGNVLPMIYNRAYPVDTGKKKGAGK